MPELSAEILSILPWDIRSHVAEKFQRETYGIVEY
jgi:hypothetical protein